ncbi:hypothetical protein LX80_00351 [Hydrotalea sandarakina]|jgi:hypothetical protein|uniref:Uncharacterized protein n=1 Tax=Hydrotalea sandarakina TaxID=1004304 RepID=A0A2W7RYJ2_9BACT|nr:hypothetical protein LX80_00351 [Hydrotalea sandarakina]
MLNKENRNKLQHTLYDCVNIPIQSIQKIKGYTRLIHSLVLWLEDFNI